MSFKFLCIQFITDLHRIHIQKYNYQRTVKLEILFYNIFKKTENIIELSSQNTLRNGFPFGSKSKGKLSPRSYPIPIERKWNTCFLSVPLWVNVLPKTTAIRRADVRETGVSRHQEGPIEAPLKPPVDHSTIIHVFSRWCTPCASRLQARINIYPKK